MKNIEFKSELRDIELARATCLVLGARRRSVLHQTDEFVQVAEGRLKRRSERIEGEPGTRVTWIWYDRPDRVGPRGSRWTKLDDRQVDVRWPGLDRTVVKLIVKRRELWMLENVRIHLDAVAGLGNYFELEGVCGIADDPAEARLKVETLLEKFRPALGEAVSGSYADL
jgi:adenylate cyclase class IV